MIKTKATQHSSKAETYLVETEGEQERRQQQQQRVQVHLKNSDGEELHTTLPRALVRDHLHIYRDCCLNRCQSLKTRSVNIQG